jgi:biopolymer transport protein ExbB
MKTTMKTLVAAVTMVCVSSFAQAQSSTTLQDLLQKVKQEGKVQSSVNQQREAEFRQERADKQGMLRKAQADLRAEEARGDRLAKQFAANEQTLVDKEVELDTAQGDLGEMFGVVRQASADAFGRISTSIVSAQYPGRDAFLAEMSKDSKGLPNIKELRELWVSLQTEMTASGQIEKFETDVLNLDGGKEKQTVLRIGAFNLIGKQGYLVYNDEDGSVQPLGRQPDGYQVSTTQDILNASASDGFIPVYVDPSRGAILNLFKQKATMMERYHAGGPVGYTITVMLAIGLLVGLYKFLTLSAVGAKMKSQLKNIDQPNVKNPLGRILTVYQANKKADV